MKKTLIAAAMAALLCSTSCVGPNNLFRSAATWNTEATESKWLNELIHIGMWIIPVYQFALLGDIWIFNSIEFWGGKNPISEPDAPKPQADM